MTKQKEILNIGDFVAFLKPKNADERKYYKNKIFIIYKYDNQKRVYRIKTVYPRVVVPPAYASETDKYMTYHDKYNQWDQSRLKKLKLAKVLYGK